MSGMRRPPSWSDTDSERWRMVLEGVHARDRAADAEADELALAEQNRDIIDGELRDIERRMGVHAPAATLAERARLTAEIEALLPKVTGRAA